MLNNKELNYLPKQKTPYIKNSASETVFISLFHFVSVFATDHQY